MRRVLLITGAAVALLAGLAHADPLDDAKAGLAALDKGDNPTAVSKFTDALNSGRLVRTDRELAYVKRAEAYLALGASDKALSDANLALDIDPRDGEATGTRDRAEALIAQAKAASAAAAQAGMSSYDAAMTRYETEKKASADAYAKQLADHDAAESRHQAEVTAWKEDVKACQSGIVAKCGATQTAAATPKPAPAAAQPVKKPAPQVAAKATTPPPAKKAAAKTTKPEDVERPAFY